MSTTELVKQDKADQACIVRTLFRFSTEIKTVGVPLTSGDVNAMVRGVPVKDLLLPKHGADYPETYAGAQELLADIAAHAGTRA